jgi:hypothetical protein
MCARRVWAVGEVPIVSNLSVLDFLRIGQDRYVLDVELVFYLMCAPPAQEVLVEHNANYQYALEVYPIPQRFATIERVHAQILILVFVRQVYGLDLSVQLRFVMESLEVLVQCAQLEAPV